MTIHFWKLGRVTLCGRSVVSGPGHPIWLTGSAGTNARVTCRACRRSLDAQAKARRGGAQYVGEREGNR